jgi:hypothetical protein
VGPGRIVDVTDAIDVSGVIDVSEVSDVCLPTLHAA